MITPHFYKNSLTVLYSYIVFYHMGFIMHLDHFQPFAITYDTAIIYQIMFHKCVDYI